MIIAALVLFGVYMLLGFGIRTWVQLRHTGDSGFRGISGHPGDPEWRAGVLFVVALLAGLLGPIAALAGLDAVAVLIHPAIQAGGMALALIGITATVLTQVAMGTSWRIGVDDTERTELVTTGPFALVRNPIFTAMAITGIGLVLMVPNAVALAGAGLLLVALHLQVRVVEEPYLVRTHGEDYTSYAASTGRFVPGLGQLRL
ncbi:MAG: methyltransferase family protein [Nocardioides sp.]|uniref:methyltransferase family protein n=1 Tax=Nocardioides sp. TaxID=35761 RepID=UPI003D6AF514